MRFSDIPYFLLIEYINYLIGDRTREASSYLIGPQTTVVARGGAIIELYAKNEDYGYEPMNFNPNLTKPIEDEFFNFDKQLKIDPRTSEITISESTSAASFVYYSSEKDLFPVQNGREMYIRKDSTFHDWIKENAESLFEDKWKVNFIIDNYINVNKKFIYFGKIYETSRVYGQNTYHITYEGMKDYAYRAVPQHQRSDKLRDFFEIAFDRFNQEPYNLLKNIWSLIDPGEVDKDYLYYLAQMYNFDTDDTFIDRDALKREFTRNLIHLLKRKGAYTSLFAIWKAITGSVNRLNIYERWHDKDLTGDISENDWVDYLYFSHYLQATSSKYLSAGAGETWYREFIPGLFAVENAYIVGFSDSSTWHVVHNLNSLDLFVSVFDYDFEEIKPREIEILNRSELKVRFEKAFSGSVFIKKASASDLVDSSSKISHSFTGKAVMVQALDSQNKVTEAEDITLAANEVTLKGLDESYRGILFEGDNIVYQNTPTTTWNLKHNFGRRGVIVQTYNGNDVEIIPDVVHLYSRNQTNITFTEPVSGYAVFAEIGSPYESEETALSGLALSPHYIIEPDFTTEPVDTAANKIFTERIWDDLYNYWELIRPVTRVSKYEMIISPKTDFSGRKVDLYNTVSTSCTTEWKGGDGYFKGKLADVFFQEFINSLEWVVDHEFGTKDVILEIFDEDFQRIVPKDIEFLDGDQIFIKFHTYESGIVVVRNADYSEKRAVGTGTWNITHNLGIKEVIAWYRNLNDETFYSDNVTLVDSNNLSISNMDTGFVAIASQDYVHTQSTPDKLWQVVHSLGTQYVFIETYDNNNEKIVPKETELINSDTTYIYFDEPIDGYAVVIPATFDTRFDALVERLGGTIISPTFKLGTQTSELSAGVVYSGNLSDAFEDDSYIYFLIEVPEGKEFTLREAGLFDNATGDMLFYTYFDDLFKPTETEAKILYRVSKKRLPEI